MSSPSGQLIGGLLALLVPIHLLAAPQIPSAPTTEPPVSADVVAGAAGPEPDAWPVPPDEPRTDDAAPTPATAADAPSGGTPVNDPAAAPATIRAQETHGGVAKPAPSMAAVLQKARRVGVSWDLQVEVGGPVWANTWGDLFEPWIKDLWEVIKFNNPDFTAFARVRVGFLILKEPWYFGAGVTAGYGGVGGAAVGLQTDLTNVWGGLWIQGGAEWNEDHGLVLSAGGGYQVIGAEWRVYDGGRNVALLAKIRLPFGLAAFVKGVYDKRK